MKRGDLMVIARFGLSVSIPNNGVRGGSESFIEIRRKILLGLDGIMYETEEASPNKMKSIATDEYWDNHWKETAFEIVSSNHPIRQWIEREVPNTTSDSCIEIGCYPGKFLSVFGEKGYELNGIDSFPGVGALSDWFKSNGYRCNHIYQADFLTFKSPIKYDLVCSFGFIEHFENWSEILDKHLELLKTGGRIIIDVPNLNSPVYYFLYKLFEPSVLRNHVLSSMDLAAIRVALVAKGCRIDYSGYIGHFYFRFVTKHNNLHQNIERLINFLGSPFWLLPESISKRYIGIIATKMTQ